MNSPLKSLLLVLGALSLGGFVALKTAHAGSSTADPGNGNADSTGSIDMVEKHDGGHIDLAEKHDAGAALELVEKTDGGGGWISLADKHEGGSVELATEKKDGGSMAIELAAKGDGGGWVALSQATH